MWYVIQTTTGKEQELAYVVGKHLSGMNGENCFVVKRQLLKRLGGQWQRVTETMFPSYLFLSTDMPEILYYEMKKIPEYAKILGNGEGELIPVKKEEEHFLLKLFNDSDDHVVGLSQLKLNKTGEIEKIDGPLIHFERELIRVNLRKRYAVIETSIGGRKQTILLGICLEKDE